MIIAGFASPTIIGVDPLLSSSRLSISNVKAVNFELGGQYVVGTGQQRSDLEAVVKFGRFVQAV